MDTNKDHIVLVFYVRIASDYKDNFLVILAVYCLFENIKPRNCKARHRN